MKQRGALKFLLFLWGTLFCLQVGRVGFMPLDQSIVFDGAWRLLCGQIPYRDFGTPDSLTPMVLQAGLFKAFGVSWLGYCLHAAVFNGLFCCLVFELLLALGSGYVAALLYGAVSGVVYYPPFGTPYREQHAFFFALLAILMAVVAANRRESWKTDLLWLGFPFAVALAYFSKQVPTVFIVPVVLLYLVLRGRGRVVRALTFSGLGAILVAVTVVLVAWAGRMEWKWIRLYFFELPAVVGADRLKTFSDPSQVLVNLVINKAFSRWTDPGVNVLLLCGLSVPVWYAFVSRCFQIRQGKRLALLLSTTLVFLPLAGGGLFAAYWWGDALPFLEIGLGMAVLTPCGLYVALAQNATARRVRRCLHRSFPEAILALGMTWTCLVFALLSWQQYDNSVALVFCGLGIGQVVVTRLAETLQGRLAGSASFRKTLRYVMGVLPWAFAALAVVQAERFHERVNVTRSVQDFEVQPSRELSGSVVSPALAFLVLDVPEFVRSGRPTPEWADSVRQTLGFLEERAGNFVLIGDSSILYALSGRPSVSPSLWFHPGLTIPPAGSSAFDQYQHLFVQNMNRYGVRFVVMEGERTWVETRLSSFPVLEEFVQRHRVGSSQFGAFTILELSDVR